MGRESLHPDVVASARETLTRRCAFAQSRVEAFALLQRYARIGPDFASAADAVAADLFTPPAGPNT